MLDINDLSSYTSEKIIDLDYAAILIKQLQSSNKKVGLCNGGFDILHPGHMKHFEMAKKICGILFVSISSDIFVSSRKGTGRPVYNEKLRAYSVAALRWVDYVVISDSEKGTDIIQRLKPDYYIKGPDYIDKTTPGINSEREVIKSVGGEMQYTVESPMSTTEIIEYIKNKIKEKTILLIIDRDGTLIENNDFLGKSENWLEELKLNEPVVSFILALQTKFRTTKIIVTNQAGVARGYFECDTVEEINNIIHKKLSTKGVNIDNWQYCPDVDSVYAELMKNKLQFKPKYIKDVTKRKPSKKMIEDSLRELGKKTEDFDDIIVLGNSHEDKELARNIGAKFIDANGKGYEELCKEFL